MSLVSLGEAAAGQVHHRREHVVPHGAHGGGPFHHGFVFPLVVFLKFPQLQLRKRLGNTGDASPRPPVAAVIDRHMPARRDGSQPSAVSRSVRRFPPAAARP